MSGAVRVIIVGTGHGARVLLPAARRAGFEVVALVGQRAERTAKIAARHQVPHDFASLSEAIAHTHAHSVIIASPPATHCDLVTQAAAAGLHIFCEKPLAHTAEAARRMEQVTASAGVIAVIGHQMRMLPTRRTVLELIQQGEIGTPQSALFTMKTALLTQPGFRMPAWWYQGALGGGWLNASGSHLIDFLIHGFGPIARCEGQLQPLSSEEPIDAGFRLELTMASGLQVIAEQTGAHNGPTESEFLITGTHGAVRIEADEVLLGRGSGFVPIDLHYPALEAIAPSSQPGHQFAHIELPPAIALMRAFYEAVVSQTHDPLLPSFHTGAQTCEAIAQIRNRG